MKYVISFLILIWFSLLGFKVFNRITKIQNESIDQVSEETSETSLDGDLESFIRYYGGPYTESANDLIITSDGGLLMIGSTSTYTAGSEDIFIVKTDMNGEVQWGKRYGNHNMEIGMKIIESSTGDFLLLAHSNSYGGDNIHDMLIMRIDSKGDMIWKKVMGGYNEDYATDLLELEDGSIMITGYSYSYGVGQDDVFLMKMNPKGDTLWTQIYGEELNEHMNCIIPSGDGLMMAGFSKSFSNGEFDAFVIKTNLQGEIEWSRIYGGEETNRAHVIIGVEDGYIMGGNIWNTETNGMNLFLCKLDTNGNWVWSKSYDAQGQESLNSMITTNDGGVLIVGVRYSHNDESNFDDSDLLAIKTDAFGNILWSAVWCDTLQESGSSVVETADGKYIYAGKGIHPDDSRFDFLLMKLSNTGFDKNELKPVSVESKEIVFKQDTAITKLSRGIEIRPVFTEGPAIPKVTVR